MCSLVYCLQFPCPLCARKFRHSQHMKRHYFSHTGIRPFKCHICAKAFSRKDALLRHINTLHSEQSKTAGAPRTLLRAALKRDTQEHGGVSPHVNITAIDSETNKVTGSSELLILETINEELISPSINLDVTGDN